MGLRFAAVKFFSCETFDLIVIDIPIVEYADLEVIKRTIKFVKVLKHYGNGMRAIPLARQLSMAETHLGHILNRECSDLGLVIVL